MKELKVSDPMLLFIGWTSINIEAICKKSGQKLEKKIEILEQNEKLCMEMKSKLKVTQIMKRTSKTVTTPKKMTSKMKTESAAFQAFLKFMNDLRGHGSSLT